VTGCKSPTRMSAKKCRRPLTLRPPSRRANMRQAFRCRLTLRPPSRRANMRQALRALMLSRTQPPYLSGPLPLNHPGRCTNPPALRLLGCIRARPRMVNYCECRSVGLRCCATRRRGLSGPTRPVPTPNNGWRRRRRPVRKKLKPLRVSFQPSRCDPAGAMSVNPGFPG
jgi:hypothetical protein